MSSGIYFLFWSLLCCNT